MATLRQLRSRVKGITNIQQVTRAMRMVAAAKMRRAQDRIIAARPYATRIDTLLSHLASQADRKVHPLLAEREAERVCLVVVTADRGLCGGFNYSVIREANSRLQSYEGVEANMINVGRRGAGFFRRRGIYNILSEYPGIFNRLEFDHAITIGEDLKNRYISGELDRVEVVYNEFRSAISQGVVVQQLLPITPVQPEGDKFFIDYLYEPSQAAVLDALLARYLNIQMWHVLLESEAAEQGARMMAMESATKNAGDLIDNLTLELNRARQAIITKEIVEIISASEAL